MKRQTTALIFCSLLLSTCALDDRAHQKLHHRKQPSRSSQNRQNNNITTTANPTSSGTTATKTNNTNTTTTSTTNDLQLVVNATSEVISVTNLTSNASVILDFKAHLIAALNITSDAIIIVNLTDYSGVTGRLNGTLSLSNISLTLIYQTTETTEVTFENGEISATILAQLASILVQVSLELNIELSAHPSAALEALLHVANSLSTVFLRSHNGYLSLSSGTALTRIEILRIPALIAALDTITNVLINGGAPTLTRYNITVDLLRIFTARSSTFIVVIFLDSILERVSLGQVLNVYISIYQLIVTVTVLTGVSALIDLIMAITQQQHVGNIAEFIYTFIAYLSFLRAEDLRGQWNLTVQYFQSATASYNYSSIGNLAKGLSSSSYIVGGVNVTQLIDILTESNAPSKIDWFVQSLLVLYDHFPISVTFAAAIAATVRLLAQGDIYILKLLVPQVNIHADVPAILGSLLRLNTRTGDIARELSNIGVIGTILRQLERSLRRQSDLDLYELLESNPSLDVLRGIPFIVRPYVPVGAIGSLGPVVKGSILHHGKAHMKVEHIQKHHKTHGKNHHQEKHHHKT